MRHRRIRRLLSVLAVCLLACAVFAQEQPSALPADVDVAPFTPDPLGDLSRWSGRAADLASSVTILKQAQFRNLGVKNVGEALSIVTGTFVTEGRLHSALQESVVSMRGPSPYGTKILLDGLPIGSAETSLVDLAQLSLDNVAEIRIIRGPTTALFGGDSMGGVVNIITRKAPEKVASNLLAEFGTGETFEYRFSLGGSADLFSGVLSADHQQSEGGMLSDDFGGRRNENGQLRNNSEYRKDHYSGKIRFDAGDAAAIQLQGSYYQAERDIPVDQATVGPRFFTYPSWRRWRGALFAHVTPVDWFRASVRGFYARSGNKLSEYEDADLSVFREARLWRKDTGGAELLAFFDLGKWSLVKLRAFYSQDAAELDLPGIDAERFEAAKHSYAVEWEMNPVKQFLVLGGASYDIFEGIRSDRGTTDSDLAAFSPVASVSVIPIDDLTLTASFARKLRFPSIAELYIEGGANPMLDPELSDMYEFICRYRYDRYLSLRASGFYQSVMEVIRETGVSTRNFSLVNRGSHRFVGAEIEAESEPYDRLFVSLSYSYVLAEEELDASETENVFNVPENRAFGEVRYTAYFGLGAGYWVEFVSDQETLDMEGDREILNAYVLHNARIFYNYRGHLEVFVYATNLGDIYYEKTNNFGQPGRRFFGGILVEF